MALKVVLRGDLDATPGSNKDVRRMETPLLLAIY